MASSKTARYAKHADHFRSHFRDTFKKGESHTYGDYEPAYRSGFRYGTSGEHAGRSFDDLKADMRRRHEKKHGKGTWDKVKEAARYAFERGRSQRSSASSKSRSGSAARKSASSGSASGAARASSGATSKSPSGSRETASGGPGSAMREGGFDVHRKAYRSHHQETYDEGKRDFSAHEPAYRHGHRYGSADEHQGRSYDDLKPEMRRSYEEQHGTGAWAKVKDAVRHAFGNARSGSSSSRSSSPGSSSSGSAGRSTKRDT